MKRKKFSLYFESVIKNNKPILGICVGMQILFSESEEGNKKGLGFFKEKVLKLKNADYVTILNLNRYITLEMYL